MVPVAGALHASVEPPPALVTRAMAAELERRGVPVARVSPAEGYIETHWFDATTLARASEPFGTGGGVVRLRLFADPVGRGSRLFLEAVERVTWDPSVPERELERMVPDQHAVRPLLAALLEGLRPPARRPPLPTP